MSRNRIIYQSLGVFASQVAADAQQTGANTVKQLTRVQSFDSSFERNLEDINQFGNLAAIDRLDTEAPTVSATVEYYLTDGGNESALGLSVTNGIQSGDAIPGVSCISGILKKETDEKNIYLMIATEGSDASNYIGTTGVIGLGNAFITSYTLDVAVGEIPSATVELEALNAKMYSSAASTGNSVPAVNPENGLPVSNVFFALPQHKTNAYGTQPTALLPGDATLDITGVIGWAGSDLKVQSASMSVALDRTPLNKLGSRFSFAREIDFPATATLDVEAEVGDIADGDFSDLLCQTGTYDLTLKLKKLACGGTGDYAMIATLKGAKLVSQDITTAIGDNATMSASFEVPIGGPEDNLRGIFLSGTYQ